MTIQHEIKGEGKQFRKAMCKDCPYRTDQNTKESLVRKHGELCQERNQIYHTCHSNTLFYCEGHVKNGVANFNQPQGANPTTMKRAEEPTIEEYDRLLKKNLQRVVELEREVAELKAAMTDQEKKEFKEVTGFDTPEQWLSWEKGYKDGQDIILTFIAKWDGSTNSALGTMLNSKFFELKEVLKAPGEAGKH